MSSSLSLLLGLGLGLGCSLVVGFLVLVTLGFQLWVLWSLVERLQINLCEQFGQRFYFQAQAGYLDAPPSVEPSEPEFPADPDDE